ncbi:hypothetical protein [Clostridium sardiniense]|uniref:hypothetical protein n=1 Tax=Clostridium sardiniense TaxID=29369 RepID=UPI00195E5781|nr:hypothetical protein [Clostridium sardiniense]MBM7835958.1 chaperonin cofactor prefoldin [Clostridium sardiniense]
MFKVSDEYKKEINKLGGRSFVSKVLIRDKTYNDDLIIDMSLEESVNPGDNFSLGSVVSNTFSINLINLDEYELFDNAIVKPYIGLKLEQTIEYIPLGIFTVSNVTKKNKKVKLECVDNMVKLEEVYFSDLSYPANINAVLKEICSKAKITCNSTLPNYSIEEIKGYSLRQAIGIIATLCGCFAKFNRIGELEISTYKDEGLKITPDIFFTFENNDKEYTIEKITAKRGEKTFSKGIDIGRKIQIDNPVITEDILNDLYTKYKGFSYMPYSLKWQGNLAVQAGDRVTIVDLDGKVYNTLIMEHKLTYKGSISSEIKATGKTKAESKFDRKGSITQAMENYAIEQATIKKALIDKADINELNALNGKIQILYTEDLTGIRADIKTIKTKDLTALESKLTHALIGKADVNELNVAVERVGILEGKTLSVENQLAGNLTAKNFKANSIVAGSAIIAENAIGSSQISSLSVNKLEAGDISTSKFRIISANGSIQIVGNQLLVNRDNITRVVLGEYRKQDNTTDYGLLIRSTDGKTVMFDSEGVHNAGITNGAIDNNKVSDNANIAGNKLDINSVIREVNNGTETIKGTKVTVGDRTLDVELSTQKNTITEHGKELSTQKASIQALDNSIKLKVDNQTFTQATSTINSNINNALNSAKEFTTAQITTTNSNLSKATSEINILKDHISSKVGQTDIDKSISNIKFGGRNLGIDTGFKKGFEYWTPEADGNTFIIIKDDVFGNVLKSNRLRFTGTVNTKDIKKNDDITISFWAKSDIDSSFEGAYLTDGSVKTPITNCKTFKLTSKWQYFSFTQKALFDGNNGQRLYFYSNGIKIMYLAHIKIEKGTKPTDYTEAPEDLNQAIIDSAKVVTDKINDVSTKFTQAKDSLQASVNSTTQTITTNLTNATNNLTNKINTAKTDAINSSKSYADIKKNEAISSANSHADNVAISKSNEALNNAKTYTNTQITTVNTRVSNAESSINILKGQISTKVSQSDIDRTVNNIKFGGRNLIPNSYINADTSDYGAFGRVLTVNLQEGETYCLSIRGHINQQAKNDGKELRCYIYEDTWSYGSTSTAVNSVAVNSESYITFIPKKTGIYKFAAYMFPSGGSRVGKVTLEWAKLEKGTKPTDWTPAPEDVNKEIKDNITTVTEKIKTVESTFTQKTNNINATVSSVQSILNTKADGSTVSSMQSQLSSLNIGLNGIKLEVNKKTDKGSIISEINQSSESVKINASKIELNGVTTFSNVTGLKAIEIQKNSIDFYDWEGSERKDNVGTIYSVRINSDAKKTGLAIGHEKNAVFTVVYKSAEEDTYRSYIEFDKYKVIGHVCPITFYEEISLNGNRVFLNGNKANSFFENVNNEFYINAKHGVQIIDTDTRKPTALLGSDRTAFGKWNQNFYYAEFFPGGFNFVGNDGHSLFWLDDGSRNIYTKSGVNMRVQGDLSVTGSKNRIVGTIYGDLKLNAVESTECWFTDIGIEQNRTDNNGDCIIWFDNKFLSTVNTRYKYKIDVTPIGEFASNGKLTYVRVVEKTEKYFKVRGTPSTLFDWTITAKQKGYERDRLEVMEKAS